VAPFYDVSTMYWTLVIGARSVNQR
jgi:hypothetical protein